jgi:hypothetical protein
MSKKVTADAIRILHRMTAYSYTTEGNPRSVTALCMSLAGADAAVLPPVSNGHVITYRCDAGVVHARRPNCFFLATRTDCAIISVSSNTRRMIQVSLV